MKFHFGFFPVSCRVSYRDFLSGVLNVQMGFFRVSLGFRLGFHVGFHLGLHLGFHLGFQFGFHLGSHYHLRFL